MFKDVPENHWAAPYIQKVARLGRMIGDSEGKFWPHNPMTRAEMAVILSRLPLSSVEMREYGMPSVTLLKGRYGQHGSGFVYKNRFVITANHVLNESGNNPPVAHFYSGHSSATNIVARHPKADLAILRLSLPSSSDPSLEIAEDVSAGEFLQVLGFPGDLEWWSVPGFVEKTKVGTKNYEFNIKGYFEKGISGGPAVNEFGKVAGIIIRATGDCVNLVHEKEWIEENTR